MCNSTMDDGDGKYGSRYFIDGPTYGKYRSQLDAETQLGKWYCALVKHLRRRGIDLSEAPSPVVEVGCGYGPLLAALHRVGASCIGTDLSLFALEAIRQTHDSWPLVACDLASLPFGSGTGGTLVACEVLEHLESPQNALREMRRVVSSGGLVIVTSPNPLGDILPLANSNLDPTHISVLRPQQWERRFMAAGFSQARAVTGYQVPYLWKFSEALSKIVPLPVVGPATVLVARP